MLLPAHIIAPAYSLFDNGALHAVLTLQLAMPLVALGLALGAAALADGAGMRWADHRGTGDSCDRPAATCSYAERHRSAAWWNSVNRWLAGNGRS